MEDRHVFPALFSSEGEGISIEFPDLPGCFSVGDNELDALQMAKEALALHIYGMERDKEAIPPPSSILALRPEANQAVVMVEIWMPPYRKAIEDRSLDVQRGSPRPDYHRGPTVNGS